MFVSTAPNVLVLHLKRFSYGNMHAKISKPISFEQFLQLSCRKLKEVTSVAYSLCSVLVHHGSSTHSGHYTAYVKVSKGGLLLIMLYAYFLVLDIFL
jgi:ubiquitin carboxyl-terminal hydrolase 36/42